MLEVDLNETDQRLAQIVSEAVSTYGRVTAVDIHRHPSPFALVQMAQHMQTLELAAQYGGSAFGTSVLIHLAQRPQ